MANIINIGVRREHVEGRARVLSDAGHQVKNAFSIAELERHLIDGGADMLVIGHNLPGPEKRRVLACVKHARTDCRVVEVYTLVPELMTADAHVCWDAGADALLDAVDKARGLRPQYPMPTQKAS